MRWLRFLSISDPNKYGVAHAVGEPRLVKGIGMVPHLVCGYAMPASMENEAIEGVALIVRG